MDRASTLMYRRRRMRNRLVLALSVAAAVSGLIWLVAILAELVWRGATGLNLQVFTQMTPPPGSDTGGILNALLGSAVLTLIGTLIGTPIGILAGTYLAEYGRGSKLSSVVRFINDVLLSAPSIVIGLFVYQTVVVSMGHFSAWAGAVALALLVIPVVVRTTENMLKLVPNQLREAASAQTAPLLFTALNNQFWSTDLNQPMANLPVMIYRFALSPYPYWQQLAWTAALVITAAILLLNIVARSLIRTKG